jgi:RNA polymerase sigma-70 factor (ECF subfamily)
MPVVANSRDTGELFQTHHDRIFRYVLRMVKNRAEAEDLTQESFLRAYRGRDSLRSPEASLGWLYRIATHVCLDRLRQRTPPLSIDSEGAAIRIQESVSPARSCLEVTERKETSACVQRCLDFLPDSYRTAILLHEAHSLTAVEIAHLLGLRVTTVKMRLHRGRRMLQQVMQCGCFVSNDSQGVPVCQPKS